MREVEAVKTVKTKEEVSQVIFNLIFGVVFGNATFLRTIIQDDGTVLRTDHIGVALPAEKIQTLPVFQDAYDQLKALAYDEYDKTLAAQAAAAAAQRAQEDAMKAAKLAAARALIEAEEAAAAAVAGA